MLRARRRRNVCLRHTNQRLRQSLTSVEISVVVIIKSACTHSGVS